MAAHCSSNQYFDILIQACKPCDLRCKSNPPLRCQSFCSTSLYNDANAENNSEYKPKKDMLSVLLVTDYNLAGLVTTQVTKADDGSHGKDAWVIWLVLALGLVLIPTLFMITVMYRRRRIKEQKLKMHEDSEIPTQIEKEAKDPVLKSYSCDEVRTPVWQNEEVEVRVRDYCDKALSDYLFPLPAIEEGAAILVTTKTSVCCNPGAGVKCDAFVEM
uniref:BCMA TALL-1 binding domain-containing protein n=1 Tax=Leptobrachium leishanense TaxID=445787 RepID=A0A8C5PPM1_9ANUR